ncbi:hypothetical protein [Pseudanabaena sp. FACHB-2040]|nr:hypothetical protein [Pseudanabaena sp. FACHB-2040]
MKRQPLPTTTPPRTNWLQFITLVLAFIGLWQVLEGGFTIIHRLF